PLPHILLKRRMRPITDARHNPMFDRVEMDVIDMTGKIVLVADGVLPKSPLPKRKITVSVAFHSTVCGANTIAEKRLDQSPAPRIVRILRRQSKDRMQMIRKHDDRIERERAFPSRPAKCHPQRIDMIDKRG